MPKVNKPQASKSRVYQVVNLKQVFGRKPSPAESNLFYTEAVDYMVRRTTSGKDRFGSKFIRYSKDYAANKGVSRGSVDLTLTGRMLNSFEESQRKDNLRLQIRPDQTPKAYGHISGFKGHRFIRNGPKRDFFGINETEATRIKNKVERILKSKETPEPEASASPVINAAALRNLFGESPTTRRRNPLDEI